MKNITHVKNWTNWAIGQINEAHNSDATILPLAKTKCRASHLLQIIEGKLMFLNKYIGSGDLLAAATFPLDDAKVAQIEAYDQTVQKELLAYQAFLDKWREVLSLLLVSYQNTGAVPEVEMSLESFRRICDDSILRRLDPAAK